MQENVKTEITIDILKELLKEMVEDGAIDIFFVAGRPISYKVNHRIDTVNSGHMLLPGDTEKYIMLVYEMANRDPQMFLSRGDDDFSFAVRGVARFRISAYRQRGSCAAVIRVVAFSLPNPEDMHIPGEIVKLSEQQRGLVLVTGSSSSGKTTTLTCILDEINKTRHAHIITLEDPIEYLHGHKSGIITQREISLDTDNYPTALRAALRQSPDVILIGELRDEETIKIALTAAETGHLVFSALHTLGAANAIDRLVDSFPHNQQNQIRMQLSMVLQTVVCQQLIPTNDGKLMPAFEVMHCNTAIRTLIRDGRTHQINSIIQSSTEDGMISMDASIAEIYKKGLISKESALTFSLTPPFLLHLIGESDSSDNNNSNQVTRLRSRSRKEA